MSMKRTVTCGELRTDRGGDEVVLNGWVHRRRDHGGLIFIDMRDRYGITQVVFSPKRSPEAHVVAQELRAEYVIAVSGVVADRPPGTLNPELATGEVELQAGRIEIIAESETPPFYINEEVDVDETLRLKYRYLDLRRARQRENIVLRHRLVKLIRDYMNERDFLDIETPILVKSTPEGSRDFIVPSRVHKGTFYALPQSPQQMKQILMIAGFDRYYQIARCFRDEDPRADRSLEHTQLDVEMAFVDEADVMEMIEGLQYRIVEELSDKTIREKPFPRIPLRDSLALYGKDNPDLRFDMKLKDISDVARDGGFRVFDQVLNNGGVVKALALPGCADFSRGQIDDLAEILKKFGAKGQVSISRSGTDYRSPIKSALGDSLFAAVTSELKLNDGDLALMVGDSEAVANASLGMLRETMGDRLGLRDKGEMAFAWIVGFPVLEAVEGEDRFTFSHNPFCGVADGDEGLLDTDPLSAASKQYDLVCNGLELGGGSVRIHDARLQRKIFRLLGYSDEQIEAQFGGMLRAFDFGAPPHGGIAVGIDRVAMLLRDSENLREIVAFPKTQEGVDLAQGAPSAVTAEQLDELGLLLRDEPEPISYGE
jgi:aspartyl-tRNA synthetase